MSHSPSDDDLTSDESVDPCEKCGTPVYGWVDERCCDGRECACQGRSITPCWCDKCWQDWEARRERDWSEA